MNVTREMVINAIDCPVCGSPKGSPCIRKNGRNHHVRQINAQKIFTELLQKKPRAKNRKPAAPSSPRRKPNAAFYASWEWKELRYATLLKYGRRCMCCGWQPGDTAHGRLCVDHIKPRSKYPHLQLEPTNTQILCDDCNRGKSNKDQTRFEPLADDAPQDIFWMDEMFSQTMQ